MPAYLKDDEDFKSRYQVETAGMPSYLATAAANNLATQDAAMTRVNAVARLNPQSSADFPPITPSLQPSNTPTSLSDLHSDDIATRRAAIDDQKKQIQARLGIIKPQDAGLAAVVLAGPHERKDLLGNLAVLEHESDNLLREHHLNAIDSARTAHENFARQKHIDTATEFSSMMSHLQDVRKNTKRGTPEREEALLNAAVKFPAAFSSGAGQTIFKQMAQEHDAAAAILPPGYETVPSTVGPDGKIHYKVAPAGTAELEKVEGALKEKYGLTLKEIKAPENIESGNVVDGKFTNANKGTHFRVSTKQGEIIIPRAEFESFGGHISEADKTSVPQVPSIPPPTDRAKGQVYETPRGKMKWTGTGWVQP